MLNSTTSFKKKKQRMVHDIGNRPKKKFKWYNFIVEEERK